MSPSPADVEARGLLGRRLELCRERQLLSKDEDALLAAFEKRPGSHPWIGEHVGKWLDAAATEFTRTRDERLRAKLDRVASRLRNAQEADGYLGTYPRDRRWTEWDVWVHKYVVLGLLAHHESTGDARSLEAARRIGELLRKTFPLDGASGALDPMSPRVSTHRGMAAGSVLVAVCRLVRATRDEKLLEFAWRLARQFEAAGGPLLMTSLLAGRGVHETANAKAYELLSCLCGLVELAELLGAAKLREPAIRAFDDVVARQLYVTGGLSFEEYFRAPGTLPSTGDVAETCAVVTWMQLCASLFEATGERRFLEPFERALWNDLLAAQRDDGGAFGYFTPLAGPRRWRDDLNCCDSSGPRGLSLAPQRIFSLRENGATRSVPRVQIDLLADARLRTNVTGADVDLSMATSFPTPGDEKAAWSVSLEAKCSAPIALAIAIPSWTPSATLRALASPDAPQRATSGETIVVTLPAGRPWRFELALDGVAVKRVEGHGRESGRVAFEHGPFVLARPRGGGEPVPFFETGSSDPNRSFEVWQEAST
jgi:uncharacterized protein